MQVLQVHLSVTQLTVDTPEIVDYGQKGKFRLRQLRSQDYSSNKPEHSFNKISGLFENVFGNLLLGPVEVRLDPVTVEEDRWHKIGCGDAIGNEPTVTF